MYSERVTLIEFGVDVTETVKKSLLPPLVIGYAGRGGAQKRIPLLNQIAEFFINEKAPVLFRFAGTFSDELSTSVKDRSEVLGVLTGDEAMRSFFSQAHVLLMTSAYEGFPVVIKESLANGCVPVVPALPGIRTRLTDGENALLIFSVDDEERVVAEGISLIRRLLAEPATLERLSHNGYVYAKDHFDKRIFREAYHRLLS